MYLSPVTRFTIAAFSLAALTGRVFAQGPAEIPDGRPAAVNPLRRNAVRLDVGSVLGTNFLHQLNGHSRFLFPVLASYERQVSGRFSIVAEGLVNGGEPEERRVGASVQSRYYYLPRQPKGPLAGFYVAPGASYRALRINREEEAFSQHFLGTGALAGWQGMLPHPSGGQSRAFIDMSLGVMTWRKVGAETGNRNNNPVSQFHSQTYYERRAVVLDGRLGVGVRF
ncbi:MAG TPA: hypothetical protein VF630_15240 [Hymenobacter sp.]|jgi:hypothetical protein